VDLKTNNRTTGLVVGMLFLLLALPAHWLTIDHPEVAPGSPFPARFPDSINANGVSGNLTLLSVQMPFWLVIALGLLALSLALLNLWRVTALPRLAFIAPWLVSATYVGGAIAWGTFSDRVTLRVGAVLAAVGLGLGCIASFPQLRKPAP
jgi:hypothetical protein